MLLVIEPNAWDCRGTWGLNFLSSAELGVKYGTG